MHVSAASGWEIATKVRLGKLPGVGDLVKTLPQHLRSQGFDLLPITLQQGLHAGSYPMAHRDPYRCAEDCVYVICWPPCKPSLVGCSGNPQQGFHLGGAEVARVLRPVGYLVSTFPFAHGCYETIVRGQPCISDWELRTNLTAYDALYVALAKQLGATLLKILGPLAKPRSQATFKPPRAAAVPQSLANPRALEASR